MLMHLSVGHDGQILDCKKPAVTHVYFVNSKPGTIAHSLINNISLGTHLLHKDQHAETAFVYCLPLSKSSDCYSSDMSPLVD